ncbi:MAG: hypothetical protein V3T22_08510 [Planctomycetota bacterium]
MARHPGPQLHAAWIAAAAGLVPLLAIHVCWAISSWTDAIGPGFPYLDGSTSISRACRQEPAVHVFRALVLPSATLAALTWWICAGWLGTAGLAGRRARRWVLGLGLVAALFLVLYAAALGTRGDVYRLMRRYGIYVFFGGTAVLELIVTILLSRARPPTLEPWVRHAMWAACWLMLAAGPINIVASQVVDNDVVGNSLEWWFALAMIGYPLLLARVWAREGLRLELAHQPGMCTTLRDEGR